MKGPEPQYIVVVKQSKVSSSIFEGFKRLGFSLIYIGQEVEAGSRADIWLREPITRGALFFAQALVDKVVIDVITLSEDAVVFQHELKGLLRLPHLPVEVVKCFRDKLLMNSKLNSLGLPVAKQIPFSEALDTSSLNFPLFIKPTTGYSSAGAQRIESQLELKKAVRNIKRINEFALRRELPGNVGIVLEEYIEGKEFSIDALSINGKTKIFCICEREFPSADNYQDYIYKSCSEDLEEKIIRELTPALDILFTDIHYTGASHTEVRYCDRQTKWFIIETALRIGFSGVIADYFRALSDIDYMSLFLNVIIGRLSFADLEAIAINRNRAGLLMILPTGEGGEIVELIDENFLKAIPSIYSYLISAEVGQRVLPYPKGIEYLGHIIATCDNLLSQRLLIIELREKISFRFKEKISE